MTDKSICKKVASMLSLYIDNNVTSQESAMIQEHLASCEECHKKYLYLKSLINDLKDSYKQVLELAVKKQQQKIFNIREYEKFQEKVSPYVDNELDAQECFEFRKYLMKSKNAQKELKNLYFIQKEMRHSYEKRKTTLNQDVSKVVMKKLKNKSSFFETENLGKIRELYKEIFAPRVFKIAILTGLVLICGYEIEQLSTQTDILPQRAKSTVQKVENMFHSNTNNGFAVVSKIKSKLKITFRH